MTALIQHIITISCFGLMLAALISAVLISAISQIAAIRKLISSSKQVTCFEKFLISIIVLNLIVYGSTKPLRNQAPRIEPVLSEQIAGDADEEVEVELLTHFTSNEINVGIVSCFVRTNETWSFDLTDNSAVIEKWRLRGAANDFAKLGDLPWVVFADGRLQDSIKNPTQIFSPFNTSLGIVPECNWHLIEKSNSSNDNASRLSNFPISTNNSDSFSDSDIFSDSDSFSDSDACLTNFNHHVKSRVWHESDNDGALVVSWQDVLHGRMANHPVSFQIVMESNGYIHYRYNLSLANIDSLGGTLIYAEVPPTAYDNNSVIPRGEERATWESLRCSSSSLPEKKQNESLILTTNLTSTNELVSWKLFDALRVSPCDTNVIWQRTFKVDRSSQWEQYFISSHPAMVDDCVFQWRTS